jgi:predicted unusual protein kinase regulating ubiquinone biosynthesis (AarF/ABC1/UbiB family)
LESKKQLVSLFLGDNLTAPPLKKFETMLMGSGPGFQKFLQVMAGNPKIPGDLRGILKKLESKGMPIPQSIVKRILESERHIYHWVSYELKPLGTGTMAQTNRARIKTPDGREIETATRIPKPDAPRRVAEDAQIMLQIVEIMDSNPAFREAGFPKLRPVVEDSNKGVADELIRALTVKHQNLGRPAYERSVLIKADDYKNFLRIKVPFVVDGGSGSKLIVQELVTGSSLENELHPYSSAMPNLDKFILEQLASMWAEQAFFGSGFFHADLHPGNFLVQVTDHEIVISILDFGMGGVITKEMQKSLVQIAMGLQLDRPEMVSQGFWAINLPQLTTTSEAAFTEQVSSRMTKIRSGVLPKQDLTQWMGWAMDQGIRFPYEIVSLNRGMIALDQALETVGSRYRVASLAEKLAPRFGRNIILELKQKGMFTAKELLKLGMTVIMTPVETLSSVSGSKSSSVPQCSKVHSGKKSGPVSSNDAFHQIFAGTEQSLTVRSSSVIGE